MNDNVKTAAAIIAAVAVVGMSAHRIITRNRKDADPIEETVEESTATPIWDAFSKAQDEISERIMAGYYDNCPDDLVTHDYTILYNTYLVK